MDNKEKMTTSLQESMAYMKAHMSPDVSFDVVYRVIDVGGRQACIYFIDGFCKDELMMKILQYFIGLTPDKMPESAYEMAKKATPYVEVDQIFLVNHTDCKPCKIIFIFGHQSRMLCGLAANERRAALFAALSHALDNRRNLLGLILSTRNIIKEK